MNGQTQPLTKDERTRHTMARKAKAHEDGPYTNEVAKAQLKARWGEGAERKAQLRADWHEVDPIVVHSLVSGIGLLGGAVTLGVDKQGAGYTVAAWLGGEKVLNRWYRGDPEGVQALELELQDFCDDLHALSRET